MKIALLVVLLGLSSLGPALADGQPWEQGVSASDQERANAIFAEANTLFAQQAHAAALAKYQAAIAIWDHPVIRFNMAVTLIRLEKFLEAADAMDAALRFGKAPFTPQLWGQVNDYKTLLDGKVGTIEATCTQDRAKVLLDGKEWFACPGTQKRRVLAGEHTVSGEHSVLLARQQRVTVTGGGTASTEVKMLSLDQAVRYERRWSAWKPWTTIGVGGVGFLAGLGILFIAKNDANSYDQRVASACAINGCNLENPQGPQEEQLANDLNAQHDKAETRFKVADVTLAVSSALVLTGIVLALINRPHAVRVDAHSTAGGATASLGWDF